MVWIHVSRDMGPNCLQRLIADHKLPPARKEFIRINCNNNQLIVMCTTHCERRLISFKIATPKIVSEYDQEIPQSQTADYPLAPRGRAAQP